METGFLNPVHDEEHFSSFYNQGNVLEDSEHMLFGEMIVPEIVDYDNLWPSGDDTCVQGEGSPTTQKEKYQKLIYEWQHQLNYMQEPEAIEKLVPLGSSSTEEVSEMFPSSVPASSTPTPSVDPSIDELFPLETIGKDREEINSPQNEQILLTKQEILESPIKNQLDFMKTESIEAAVKTAAPKIKQELNTRPKIEKETTAITVELKQNRGPEIPEEREKEVDVETVGGEEIPLLMAGDLTSLLEQFEATEKFNAANTPLSPPSPPRPSNQTIREALPAEVINRIKATRENHKKMISVIPAMPNKRSGRAATRMQDAGATLSRNKLLKLVTGGSSGESVQLDHDYCTNGGDTTSNSSRSCYMSDSSEYPSQSSTPDRSLCRMPDFKPKDSFRASDTGSRKDSGLESGENSDEEVPSHNDEKRKTLFNTGAGLRSVNMVKESGVVMGNSASKIHKNVPMVSVLKKRIKVEKDFDNSNSSAKPNLVNEAVQSDACTPGEVYAQEVVRKKKKLNLEEYRVRREERERIRSQESSRANSPAPFSLFPVQPDSTTSVCSQAGVPKEKPLMLSVEVQTQTCDWVDLTHSKSSKEHEKSRIENKEKRNDLKYRSYHASSSSSQSSADSDRHRSYRKKRSSRRRSRSRSRRRNSVSRMWSRSPSHSSSGSQSEESSRSRSRSRSRERRQKWRSRSPRRNNRYDSRRGRNDRDRSWQRNRSPVRGPPARVQDFPSQEKVRQVEERRVIYVGRIDEGTTKADLRTRFQQFGSIVDISVHFRERGDNYGFVTFAFKADAYKAVEHGNDDPKLPRYDLCFGGRRAFCKQRYSDLDGQQATNTHCQYGPPVMQPRSNDSFDLLLNEVKQAQLRKRSSV